MTPFEELRVDYAGKVVLLDEPEQMANPKQAFTDNPYAECEVHLTFTGQGRPSMFGGEPDTPHETPGEEFAKGHYEQLVAATGTIRVGEREWEINGHGLRDHSWGPRFWQAPWYYRWLTANVDRDFGFMASRVAKKDAPGTRGGFVWEHGQMHYCDHVELEHRRPRGDAGVPRPHRRPAALVAQRPRVEVHRRGDGPDPAAQPPPGPRRQLADDPHQRGHDASGRCNRAPFEGRVGYGLSEYLDQIIDDQPVGLAE